MSNAGSKMTLAHPEDPAGGRSLLAHLLHALNQPLTGLQCALELAASGPANNERYLRTLHDGLELTTRMRLIVEALRELADIEEAGAQTNPEPARLDSMLAAVVADLMPVAESKRVSLRFEGNTPVPLRAQPAHMQALLFRLLESVLSLAQEGSSLEIAAMPEGGGRLAISWTAAPAPEYSPYSGAELGLLIAQAGWEQSGARWIHARHQGQHVCTILMPIHKGSEPASPDRSAPDLAMSDLAMPDLPMPDLAIAELPTPEMMQETRIVLKTPMVRETR